MYCTAGWESQAEWLQLSDQQPELTTAGLIWFRRGHVVAFQTLKPHRVIKDQWWCCPRKGQAERCSSFPSTNQGCQNIPTRNTQWEIRHQKGSKSENKVDFSIYLLLASGQKSCWRAMSDMHVQLVYHLSMAKVILWNTDHVYESAGSTPNVKGRNYYSASPGKICHHFLYQRIILTRKKWFG